MEALEQKNRILLPWLKEDLMCISSTDVTIVQKKAYDAMKLCEASVVISTFSLFTKVSIPCSTARWRSHHKEQPQKYWQVSVHVDTFKNIPPPPQI